MNWPLVIESDGINSVIQTECLEFHGIIKYFNQTFKMHNVHLTLIYSIYSKSSHMKLTAHVLVQE